MNGTTHFFKIRCCCFPKLTRSQFGIFKRTNQRSIHFFGLLMKSLACCIFYNFSNGKPFGSLRSPGRIYIPGMTPPKFFCISLKKHGIQLSAKLIDIKVLQTVYGFLSNHTSKITKTCLHGSAKAHIFNSVHIHTNRILKEFSLVINMRNTTTIQHNAVNLLRVRTTLCQRNTSAEFVIIICRCTLHRHNLLPPVINLL